MRRKATNTEMEKQAPNTEKKKQAPSASYSLRALGETTKKLLELELLTKEEAEVILEINKNAINAWTKKEFGI